MISNEELDRALASSFEKELIKWMEDSIDSIGETYKKLEPYGVFAKDENFPELLESKFESSNGRFKGQILGPDYTYWLEHGRGPTKNRTPHNPTVKEVVLKWIKRYNVQDQYNKNVSQNTLAFFISRSIHNYGIKVPGKYNPGGLISDTINDDSINNLMDKLKWHVLVSVKSDVIKTFK